jgi:ribosome maturation factor RimP
VNHSDTRDALRELLEEPLASLGLDLEAVELSQAGKRSTLRIAVDKDGGVTLDDVADATKAISEILDNSDIMGQNAYTLEVSSPGVGRPLTLPRHWRRNNGKLVKVVLGSGETVEGRIKVSGEESATLEISDKSRKSSREIDFAEVKKAKIQVEFKRTEGEDV